MECRVKYKNEGALISCLFNHEIPGKHGSQRKLAGQIVPS